MAAIFTDALIRLKHQDTLPRRTIKLALTCGEETDSVFNGVQYLLANDPTSLDAGFALNEGGKSWLDEAGLPVVFGIQAGEKIYQDFTLTTTGPGGHSSRPGKDNPITRLANGLARLGAYSFPAEPNATTRNFFARSAPQRTGEIAAAMRAVGRGEDDLGAFALLSDSEPIWNAMLRTTCVVTIVDAGHAINAIAQHAEANVNCRILPGQSVEHVKAALEGVLADPSIEVAMRDAPGPVTPAPPLTPEILGPIEAIAGEKWPGVPVIPSMSTGATDGRFLLAAGIPTYGVSGIFVDPDGNGVHGLNERLRIKSLMDARDFLHRLSAPTQGQRHSEPYTINASNRAPLGGLALFVLLLVQGLSGAILVFRDPLGTALHPVLTPGALRLAAPVQVIVDSARSAYPEHRLRRIDFPAAPGQAAMAELDGPRLFS